ncbi:hypothetical protein D918_09008 [Trichuris suis]|nr:hypothetical protein D918_09008 [Trichuris suis]
MYFTLLFLYNFTTYVDEFDTLLLPNQSRWTSPCLVSVAVLHLFAAGKNRRLHEWQTRMKEWLLWHMATGPANLKRNWTAGCREGKRQNCAMVV